MKSLSALIPGYSSYRIKESRREDDRLTREFVIKRIDHCKSRLDALGLEAAQRGDLELPLVVERFRNELDRARSRIAAAVEGYSGWFDSRSADEELLKQLSQQDENLVSVVDLAEQLLGQLPLPQQHLQETLQLLHQRIDRRAMMLKQD